MKVTGAWKNEDEKWVYFGGWYGCPSFKVEKGKDTPCVKHNEDVYTFDLDDVVITY